MNHLFCALDCEAGPIIDAYRLHLRTDAGPFNIYTDKDGTLSLTVTGVGKPAMAAAVGCLTAFLPVSRRDGWLNVGIAGHPDFEIGAALLVNKIVEQGSGKTWYPQILFDSPLPRAMLVTVDEPVSDYTDEVLYDMEGAGFYDGVSRVATAEMAHCLKIVSDNRLSPAKEINKRLVRRLVAGSLDGIEHTVSQLTHLAGEPERDESMEATYRQFIDHWHFSQTEKIQLKNLLNRWRVLLPGVPPLAGIAGNTTSGGEILIALRNKLDGTPVRLG